MNKKLLFPILFAPLVFLAAWTSFLSFERGSGHNVIVSIKGYDPRDLLSGRYLAFQIDWEKTDCSQFENNVCPQNEFCKEAAWGRACRFYVSEFKAQKLDLYALHRRDEDKWEVVYAYTKGRTPLAKKLLINGKDWESFSFNPKNDVK